MNTPVVISSRLTAEQRSELLAAPLEFLCSVDLTGPLTELKCRWDHTLVADGKTNLLLIALRTSFGEEGPQPYAIWSLLPDAQKKTYQSLVTARITQLLKHCGPRAWKHFKALFASWIHPDNHTCVGHLSTIRTRLSKAGLMLALSSGQPLVAEMASITHNLLELVPDLARPPSAEMTARRHLVGHQIQSFVDNCAMDIARDSNLSAYIGYFQELISIWPGLESRPCPVQIPKVELDEMFRMLCQLDPEVTEIFTETKAMFGHLSYSA